TTMWLTASLFNTVIDQAPEALHDVRQLLAGGEALSLQHVQRAQTQLPGLQLINGYGPTESTTFACCWPLTNPLPDGCRSVPIGRPITGTRGLILGEYLQPVPMSMPGELYIGGGGLARGYLHQPGFTAERFIPDPSAQQPGERLYRTGDSV